MGKIFPTNPANTSTRMHECGVDKYWFYHVGSYPGDPPLLYQQIIAAATSKIEIWDPYIHCSPGNDDMEALDGIADNITLKILTIKSFVKHPNYLSDVLQALKMRIHPSKNLQFALRVIDKGDFMAYQSWSFHDRFLIIDDADVFLVGGSVGWHVRSQQSTGIFKVDNPETCAFIKSVFAEYWLHSAGKQIPLQFLHP
jgi:hypothetical protein